MPTSTLTIDIIPQASAATRLLRSPSGRYLLAELRGRWAREAFGEHAGEVPPVLKLIERATGKVVAVVNGWPLGAPDDDGDVLYLEEHEAEYRYRVRSLAHPERHTLLAPPAGSWLVKAGLQVPAAQRALVVLWSPVPGEPWREPRTRRERLWFASLDHGSLAVAAEATMEMTTPRLGTDTYGVGIVASPTRGEVYVATLPERSPAWPITAVDAASLTVRWTGEVAAMAQGPVPSSPPSPPSPSSPPSPPSVERERVSKSVLLAAAGDGTRLLAVHGASHGVGVAPEAVLVFDAASGRQLGAVRDLPLGLAGVVHELVPVPDTPAVAMLHYLHYRDLGSWTTRLQGITRVKLDALTIDARYERSAAFLGAEAYERVERLVPGGLTAGADGTMLLAPQSYAWSKRYGYEGPWLPDGPVDRDDKGRGTTRPEVRGLVQTPRTWHRAGRPRVDERLQAWGEARR